MFPTVSGLKKIGNWIAPPPNKSEDGRDLWPSRAAFLLAAMGGCAGMGNLIRYPSQVYNNYGLQWFIPYLVCVILIAIPALTLEIAVGQAYRGGSVVAFNNVNQRLKGTGLSMIYVSWVVLPYFAVNLSWIMAYFRHSFSSPLPWTNRAPEFFDEVISNPEPIPGSADGSSVTYTQYPAIGMVGETTGWMVFTWFLMWLCTFRGVGLTGRVVYVTMGLPVIMTIVIVGRALSLDNASEGVKLFWATWRGSELARGEVWQTACGQVFFSTGVGFGYFTSYASYNRKHSNAVVDAIAIVSSNVVFENFAAFATYGVVGFSEIWPEDGIRLGGFQVGFLTLPLAIVEMPGANFWAVALFFTLMALGFSSGFAMLDAVSTTVMDTGIKWPRPLVVTVISLVTLLLSLPYCTEFGYHLLNGIDRWVSDVALVFVVWAECVTSMTLYRWRDVYGQVGKLAFLLYQLAYFGGQVFGVIIAQSVSAEAGAGVGFGVYIAATLAALVVGETPDTPPPQFWSSNVFLTRFWYMAFYSGNQLRRDLNVIVGSGNNWRIPPVWGPLLKYVSAPALAIVYSFSYSAFYAEGRFDPLQIMGFAVAHICLLLVFGGFIIPRWFNVLIPPHRRREGQYEYAPCVLHNTLEAEIANNIEEATAARNDVSLSEPVFETSSDPSSEGKDAAANGDIPLPQYGKEPGLSTREETSVR